MKYLLELVVEGSKEIYSFETKEERDKFIEGLDDDSRYLIKDEGEPIR